MRNWQNNANLDFYAFFVHFQWTYMKTYKQTIRTACEAICKPYEIYIKSYEETLYYNVRLRPSKVQHCLFVVRMLGLNGLFSSRSWMDALLSLIASLKQRRHALMAEVRSDGHDT